MTYAHPTPPPKQGMSSGGKVALGCGISAVLAAALLFGGCAVLGGAVINEADKAVKADQKEDARAAEKDIKISSCSLTADELLGPHLEAKVKITNNGSKRANYLVEGEFLDQKGDKVGEMLATVSNLAPGTSTTQDFGGLITADNLKDVTKGSCSIVKVTRDEWLAANE